tara:strand:- start:773 stop:1255 length:483 start_codon:yes stop_codon:yes gene_type:complete
MKLTENESIIKIELNKFIKRNIKIPTCQRDINEDRINEIINKVSTNNRLVYKMSPLIIGVLDNDYYILDGQHRYFAFLKLKIEKVVIQLIKVNSSDELKELFNEINQNTPLPINWLELPTKSKIRDALSIIENYIKENKYTVIGIGIFLIIFLMIFSRRK